MDNVIFGAYFKIYMQFEGGLKDLGLKLQDRLSISKVRYENREDEPYDLLGYAEILGFEIQLEDIRKN